jgi:long-chain acyl-CoA synthetase
MIYTAEGSIAAQLTLPGEPFELVRRDGRTAFRNHPATLIDLYAHALGHGAQTMTIADGVATSFETVFGRAAALSRALGTRFGVGRGSYVALAMANRVEWMIAYIAVTAAGGIAVLVNSRGAPDELRDAIERTGCGLAILDAERAALLAESGMTRPCRQILLDGGEAFVRIGQDALFDAISRWDPAIPLAFAPVGPSDGATVLFTSGTTGRPRGALQSHGAAAHAVGLAGLMGVAADRCYEQEFGRTIPPARTSNVSPTIIAGPLFHLGGYVPFLRCLYFGARTLLLGKWNPEAMLRTIEREGVTRLGFVPTMLWDMLRSPEAGPGNIGQVLFVSSGAAAISPALTREIAERMPGCMLGNTYGSTETAGYVASIWGREFLDNPTACGRIQPSVEVRLVDASGQDVRPGEAGEVAVRSPCLMTEYVGDSEGTAETIRDGWLHTGDIGVMNGDRLLHIVDRKKNMVISGGENIYCAEVERVLSEHDQVLEVLAYGVPDERLGERLSVTIVRRPDVSISEADIRSYVASRLAIYKVPREVHFRTVAFARTASGKIDRLTFVQSVRSGGGHAV